LGNIFIKSLNGDSIGPLCKGGRSARAVPDTDWASSGVDIIQNGNGFKFNFDFFFEWELLPGMPQNMGSPDYNYHPDNPTYMNSQVGTAPMEEGNAPAGLESGPYYAATTKPPEIYTRTIPGPTTTTTSTTISTTTTTTTTTTSTTTTTTTTTTSTTTTTTTTSTTTTTTTTTTTSTTTTTTTTYPTTAPYTVEPTTIPEATIPFETTHEPTTLEPTTTATTVATTTTAWSTKMQTMVTYRWRGEDTAPTTTAAEDATESTTEDPQQGQYEIDFTTTMTTTTTTTTMWSTTEWSTTSTTTTTTSTTTTLWTTPITTTTVGPTTTTSTTLKTTPKVKAIDTPEYTVCPYTEDNFNGYGYNSDCPVANRCNSKFVGPCGYAAMDNFDTQLCKPHTSQMIILAIGTELTKVGNYYEAETGDICDNNINNVQMVRKKYTDCKLPSCI